MIIGIAGSICSGKDTVAEMLAGKYCFQSFSLVDILRNEYERANIDIDTRPNRRDHANGRRKAHSAHYYVTETLDVAHRAGISTSDNIILVGLYCKGEVDFLVDKLGGVLIGVQCNLGATVRHDRFVARREVSLSPMTLEQFQEMDRLENSGETDAETNVESAMSRASYIINNDGSLKDLMDQVDRIAAQLNLEMCHPEFSCENLGTIDESYEKNMDLQINFEVFQFLKNHFTMKTLGEEERALAPLHSPANCIRELGNQFAKVLIPLFRDTDAERAWERFSAIIPSTIDEEMVLLTNKKEFFELHRELHEHLNLGAKRIELEVKKNIESIKLHDRQQFESGKRGIKALREAGIEIRVLPEHFASLTEIQKRHGDGAIPILESIKHARMLEMNFISRSKVSTIVHDAIDHVWLYSLLQDHGVLTKFSKLFWSIGNPDKCDVFRRAGEVVASIGYGVRYWATTAPGFRPNYSVVEIAERLDGLFESGETDERHLDAYRYVRRLAKTPVSREAQSLSFVFSNYLAELDEQRRKHGPILVRNEDLEIVGELDCWSADFLCLFIECHRLLLASKSKHRDNLLRVHLILENHLCSKAACEEGNVLRIDCDNLEDVNFDEFNLPAERVLWMSRNYGFTAMRDQQESKYAG